MNEDNQRQLKELDGVRILKSLLKSSNSRVCQQASRALQNLGIAPDLDEKGL